MQAPGRRRRGPARFTGATAAAASLISLWATTSQFQSGYSFSSNIACPTESLVCVSNANCSACLDTLQATLSSSEVSVGTSSGACEELFSDVCGVVAEAGCDPANEQLMDLASCVVDDTFGCAGFTSCTDLVINATAPTGATTLDPGPTAAPSSTLEASPAPTTGEVVDTFAPTPAMVGETSVPTPSSSDRSTDAGVFTASPSSADGSGDLVDPTSAAPSNPIIPATPTPVEPGEEVDATSGGGHGWRSISAAGATLARVSVVVAFALAV